MRFRLISIFYATAVIAAAIGAIGPWGLVPALWVLGLWVWVFFVTSRSVVEYLVLSTLAFALLLCLLPPIGGVREPGRRNGCASQLRSLTLALREYERQHGSLPPAYLADETGRPMHS